MAHGAPFQSIKISTVLKVYTAQYISPVYLDNKAGYPWSIGVPASGAWYIF